VDGNGSGDRHIVKMIALLIVDTAASPTKPSSSHAMISTVVESETSAPTHASVGRGLLKFEYRVSSLKIRVSSLQSRVSSLQIRVSSLQSRVSSVIDIVYVTNALFCTLNKKGLRNFVSKACCSSARRPALWRLPDEL
jgi:hypothetical protein